MKIFYSWQSDSPDKIGRSFIRQAISQAVSDISEDPDLTEAVRPEVTSDTQGVLGTPAIAETIFEKIRSARIVIIDVSLVGQTPKNKKLINSNVAIELGYALGKKGDEVLLTVMNTYFGSPEELPFDLKHRRWPVEFSLSLDVSNDDIKKERLKLAKQLANIFKEYLKAPAVPKEPYIPQQPTLNPSAYWKEGEVLVQTLGSSDHAGKQLGFGNNPRMYLHMWPDQKLSNFDIVETFATDKRILPPLVYRSSGWHCEGNEYGFISYENSGDPDELYSATQVFKDTGEIWGVDNDLLDHSFLADNDYPDYIPSEAFETAMKSTLKIYLKVVWEIFSYPDKIHIRAGITGIKGYKITAPRKTREEYWGPIYDNDIETVCVVNKTEPKSIDDALLKIFEAPYKAARILRPSNLHGFPPAPERSKST